jgi:ABC-type lipoprotein export system ATPase subunit
MLEVKGLTKKFQSGDTTVVATDDISFTVPDGQFASVVGRSGSGKSTLGLEPDQMDRKPARLSGGQQQRVAIARALANKPQLILADEPTGNLDSATGKMIFDLLHELSRKENTTIIVVTHDLEIAGKTDKTFKLEDGKLVN